MAVKNGAPIVNVGADVRVDIRDIKLSVTRPVERPGAEITDHLLVAVVRRWFRRARGGGGSMSHSVAHIVRDLHNYIGT